MATLNCKCGHKTKLPGYSENELYLLSFPLLDHIEDQMNNNNLTADEMNTFLVENAHLTYRCEKCRRLYIYDVENEELVVRIYNLEETLRDEEEEEGEEKR